MSRSSGNWFIFLTIACVNDCCASSAKIWIFKIETYHFVKFALSAMVEYQMVPLLAELVELGLDWNEVP